MGIYFSLAIFRTTPVWCNWMPDYHQRLGWSHCSLVRGLSRGWCNCQISCDIWNSVTGWIKREREDVSCNFMDTKGYSPGNDDGCKY